MEHKKTIRYFFKMENLKKVMRYSGQSDVFKETVSEHSQGVSIMAQKFMRDNKWGLNFKKVIELATHHDSCEVDMKKDYTAYEASKCKNYREDKEKNERLTVERLDRKFGKPFKRVHNEFEEQKTREAKFVLALDKMQSSVHKFKCGYKHIDADNAAFTATYCNDAVEAFPELIPFYADLQALMKEQFIKTGHEWKDEYNIKPVSPWLDLGRV